MTISTEEYRQRIGLFLRTRRASPKVKNNSKKYKWPGDRINMISSLLHILIISDLTCSVGRNIHQVTSWSCQSPTSVTTTWSCPSHPATSLTESPQDNRISIWHCQISTNKLMKMSNGNRAKSGFKHSQWNIDKGLFTMGKMEDIKVR